MNEVAMLDRLFSPRSIAVIGASKTVGKVGYLTLSNLVQSGFQGPIVPINSAGGELFGLPVYKQLADSVAQQAEGRSGPPARRDP